jgi:hypothetical protein
LELNYFFFPTNNKVKENSPVPTHGAREKSKNKNKILFSRLSTPSIQFHILFKQRERERERERECGRGPKAVRATPQMDTLEKNHVIATSELVFPKTLLSFSLAQCFCFSYSLLLCFSHLLFGY